MIMVTQDDDACTESSQGFVVVVVVVLLLFVQGFEGDGLRVVVLWIVDDEKAAPGDAADESAVGPGVVGGGADVESLNLCEALVDEVLTVTTAPL
jgi:hypothetical protein